MSFRSCPSLVPSNLSTITFRRGLDCESICDPSGRQRCAVGSRDQESMYIYIYTLHNGDPTMGTRRVSAYAFIRGLNSSYLLYVWPRSGIYENRAYNNNNSLGLFQDNTQAFHSMTHRQCAST